MTQPNESNAGPIIARVANGPHTLVVVGDTYEEIVAAAEAWVEEAEGQRFVPIYYSDLRFCKWRGVLGALDEENGRVSPETHE